MKKVICLAASVLCCAIWTLGQPALAGQIGALKADKAGHQFSDEGFFFHTKGSSSPLSEPVSISIGEHAAVLELCSPKTIANNFQIQVRKYLKYAKTAEAKSTLSKRIRASFLTNKKTLKRKTRKELCLTPKTLAKRTDAVIELMKYDWGFKIHPKGKPTTVSLGAKQIRIGVLR